MDEIRSKIPAGLILVTAIGFVMRLYACWATFIIPPDGALYLYQAKMIVNGQWDKITGCGLGYLANLPLFIAGAYTVFHDWVIAAQSISLVFGTAVLVYLYLILREFCDEKISSVATLIAAVTPVMVSRSADVVREPLFWFFLAAGIYLFIIQLKRQRFAVPLIGSQLAILMATWSRIEGIVVILVSVLYLALFYKKYSLRRLIVFIAPVLVVTALVLILSVAKGKDLSQYYRSGDVIKKPLSFVMQYHTLREQLKSAVNQQTPGPLRWFLPEARNAIWLVAAGTLLNRIAEGFFYPYLLIYLLGLYDLKKRLKYDDRLLYLALLTVAALVMLYLHTMESWMIYYRFVVFAIIPGIVFAAFGVEFIRARIGRKFGLRPQTVLVALALLILLAALPKNLILRDPDKKVFREIGRRIAAVEKDPQGARLSASAGLYRWVSFYANMDIDDPPCPDPAFNNVWPDNDGDIQKLIKRFEHQGIEYFLWEERSWPNNDFDSGSAIVRQRLQLIGQWHHPDTGKMMLFKLNPTQRAE